jgi:hypothetical protein
MSDQLLLDNHWQDWVTVLGYITFTLFIVWRVLMTK